MEIIYGTGNKGKVDAMQKIIDAHKFDVKIITLKDIEFDRKIIEDGTTFEENSNIKATEVKKFCEEKGITNKIIVTDDAGLCVDKLNGEPGVYSARYAGENATQEEILNKLLNNLKPYTKLEDRSCKFVCVLTAILPDGTKLVERGECKGNIALKPGKLGGITYGPVFIPVGFEKPMSDMNFEEFSAVHNHRDIAMNNLIKKIKEI